jgi:hypothetical protein
MFLLLIATAEHMKIKFSGPVNLAAGLKRTLQQAAGNLPREEFYLFFDSLADPAASCGECAHYRGSNP